MNYYIGKARTFLSDKNEKYVAFPAFIYRAFNKPISWIIPEKLRNKTTEFVVTFLWSIIFVVFLLPKILLFTYDAFAFNLMDKTATYTFSKAEEVGGKSEQYRTSACRKTPCKAQVDSMEFRIRDSFYMDVVWMFTRLEPYDQGELAGTFLSERNVCEVRYYGRRIKYLGIYPKIIDATCEPVN